MGGSGKQSLSRLAAYISSMEVFQVSVSNILLGARKVLTCLLCSSSKI